MANGNDNLTIPSIVRPPSYATAFNKPMKPAQNGGAPKAGLPVEPSVVVVDRLPRLTAEIRALDSRLSGRASNENLTGNAMNAAADAARLRELAQSTAQLLERHLAGQSVSIVNQQPQALFKLLR